MMRRASDKSVEIKIIIRQKKFVSIFFLVQLIPLIACALFYFSLMKFVHHKDFALTTKIRQMTNQIRVFNTERGHESGTAFDSNLSSIKDLDAVIHYMGDRSTASAVHISTLLIQPQSSTPHEWGVVTVKFSANGEYAALKSLMQDTLGRYPSIALHTVSLRGAQTGFGRLDAQFEMAIYLKD